jgi:hypothetical protein
VTATYESRNPLYLERRLGLAMLAPRVAGFRLSSDMNEPLASKQQGHRRIGEKCRSSYSLGFFATAAP